jgi:hypothetical protein
MLGRAKFLRLIRNGNRWFLGTKFFLSSFLILPLLLMPSYAQTDPNRVDPIQLVLPEGGCLNAEKRTAIKCAIKKPFDRTKLTVLLNGEGLDGVEVKPDGFEYAQTNLLAHGTYILSVIVTTFDGEQFEQEFEFSVCPSKTADEANPDQKRNVSSTGPDAKGDGNLPDESKPEKKGGESTLKTNSRLLNQNMSAHSSLSRFGMVAPPDRNLNTLGTFSLFSDSLRLKTLYMRADEWATSPETSTLADNLLIPSFGSSGLGADRRGDMLGAVLTSDLWGKKLVAEAEINLSGFNSDIRRPYLSSLAPGGFGPFSPAADFALSPFPSRRENTYRLRLKGEWENYNYEASYEYLSFDDPASGSQGITDTMQRYMFRIGGKFLQFNSVNLSFSQYTDSVKGNSLYPKLTITQAGIDYNFTKFENFPVTLSYQRTMAATKDEPLGTPGTRFNMDTVTVSMNYLRGPWNLGLLAGYSNQKDMTDSKNDTTTLALAFLPVYTWDRLSIAPGFSYGRSESRGVITNTYTLGFDLRRDLTHPRFTYGLGVAYTRLTTSDNSSRQDILSANVNFFYSFSGKRWGFLNPSIGAMGLYSTTNDRILGQTRNDYEFFLMFRAKF